jgi:hypothetical protein
VAASEAALVTVAAVIDSNAEISVHPSIISCFSLADNTDEKMLPSRMLRYRYR